MSVSQLPIRRVWSGLVTMFWPSMMSLAPPPVTPRRKLPPFLGVPAALEPPLPAGDDELLPPPQAARPPASSTVLAPTRRSRRERPPLASPERSLDLSTISSPPLDRRGPAHPHRDPARMIHRRPRPVKPAGHDL